MAIFVTGRAGAIAKTAIIVRAIRDRDVGHQSALTHREKDFQLYASC